MCLIGSVIIRHKGNTLYQKIKSVNENLFRMFQLLGNSIFVERYFLNHKAASMFIFAHCFCKNGCLININFRYTIHERFLRQRKICLHFLSILLGKIEIQETKSNQEV